MISTGLRPHSLIFIHPHLSSNTDIEGAEVRTRPPFGFHQVAQESVQRRSDVPNRISSCSSL
ncbi:hypothetical protein PGT21_036870 [Puccinia graminis f. sp. tritici]|uniref:Uncharacterized protein n=1 Tax=Puccinia graminis f. sp. tritici TaxID=56615 RepID=A0A5B0PKX4_PUCGR|nr:hypothetical protein PGT21_036870 [Puccinia graminis f. sp. tritici]